MPRHRTIDGELHFALRETIMPDFPSSLEPAPRGSRLTITEQGFVRNPIFRTVGRVFFKPTDTMTSYLTALAAAVGDSATPVILRER